MSILRTLLVVVVVVAVGFLLIGYVEGLNSRGSLSDGRTVGRDTVERARERGAELGEKTAVAGAKVEAALGEAALTSKIKAKMALDDSVEAGAINVTTHGTAVTLSGTVDSAVERDRALALARETEGVTQVINDLHLR